MPVHLCELEQLAVLPRYLGVRFSYLILKVSVVVSHEEISHQECQEGKEKDLFIGRQILVTRTVFFYLSGFDRQRDRRCRNAENEAVAR